MGSAMRAGQFEFRDANPNPKTLNPDQNLCKTLRSLHQITLDEPT